MGNIYFPCSEQLSKQYNMISVELGWPHRTSGESVVLQYPLKK